MGGEATLTGLRAATNYSVWVRARADAGPGPPAPPVYCVTAEDGQFRPRTSHTFHRYDNAHDDEFAF